MAKQGGMGDRLYVDEFNMSGDTGSLGNVGGGPNPGEVTDITQSAISRIGLERDGRLNFAAWFNPAITAGAEGSHLILKSRPTTDRIITYGIGTTLGNPAASIVSKQVNYDGTRGADGSYSHTVDVQGNGFGLEWGEQLTAGPKTDTVATNGTGIDYGSVSTLFGATGVLHVFAVTGTSITVKIQDSADNVTFADITGLTFTAVAGAAVGKERISTATGATIRRYVRAISTGTFSNAVFMVNFIRYLTAQL
jgi:hypothetical protein